MCEEDLNAYFDLTFPLYPQYVVNAKENLNRTQGTRFL
jgi:hypothetical protein